MILAGGVVWVVSSDYLLNAAIPEPEIRPPPTASWSDFVLLILGLYGMLIWPVVFSFLYLIWAWMRSRRVSASQWVRESELREERESLTQQRINEARVRGEFDRWKKDE